MKKPFRKLYSNSILILLGALLLAGPTQANQLVNVQQLNQILQKNNSGWVAKDTWVNQFSKKEAKRFLGLRGAPSAEVEFIVPQFDKGDLPTALDWRNKDGKNWISPILNQANCGSCVAFAAIGVMESQFNISSLIPGLNIRLSPQNLFSCGGGACDFGWFPAQAASFLLKKGVTDEACAPYRSGATGQDVACSAICSNASERMYKISNYSSPSKSAMDLQSVKRALQKGPLMTTLTVYADFAAYAGGIYKHTTGEALGGHAVSIVGYDDNEQAFIIRNSWSEEWGEKGFGRVAYSDISGIGRSTWLFETPATAGSVYVINPRENNYLSGPIDFKAASTYTNTDSVTLSVFDKSNQAVWTSSCNSGDCNALAETSQLPDGRYEIQALAMNEHGEKISASARQAFYVANQKPELKLSFIGTNGADLSKPLTERIEFLITATSSTVPLSSIEFHYKDSQGVDKVKSADIVLDQMTMGWRTNLLPNGNYEIWMVGHLKTNTTDSTVETAHQNVVLKN